MDIFNQDTPFENFMVALEADENNGFNDTDDPPEQDANTKKSNTDDPPEKNDKDETDENTDDNNIPDNDENDSDDEQPQAPTDEMKAALKKNMILFHSIIRMNIQRLDTFSAPESNEKLTMIFSNIYKNMFDIKNILFNVITVKFKDAPYEQLLKTYIGLKRVYDISLEMLSIYFDEITLIHIESKKANTIKNIKH